MDELHSNVQQEQHRRGEKKPDVRDMDILITCLKSVVHFDQNEKPRIKTKVPSPVKIKDPSNLRWKCGAVTEFMKRNNIAVQNYPKDLILKRILTGDSKTNIPPILAPPASSTKVQDHRESSSKMSNYKWSSAEFLEPKVQQRSSDPAIATNGPMTGKRQLHFNKKSQHFSPPRFLPTASKPVEPSLDPLEPIHANTNFTKPSLFSTVSIPTTATISEGVFKGNWKRKRDDDNVPEAIVVPTKNQKTEVVLVDAFKSAKEQLILNDRAKGIKREALKSPVQGPVLKKPIRTQKEDSPEDVSENPEVNELMLDDRMKNADPKMVEAILNEVIEAGSSTDWDDIAGLKGAKEIIKEIIIWPMLRPDIFTGLRGPPKGILLFGPPGTGKTMIGRLIATQSKSTFFNISASSLTSKWIGDGEKMVRTLFQVARVKQPAVIFIDEIDSILTQRNDTEHESSRRLKTEFLIQFDGCGSKSEDRILVIGVTNRPQELDEAARRRLVKRIYIPLPDSQGRQQLVERVIAGQPVKLVKSDYEKIAEMTEGYSGADMSCLCKEAAYGPIRDIGVDIQDISADKVRPMELSDFAAALKHVKASVMADDLTLYENWDKQFGCHV